jgi:hypothetical protein
MINLKQYKEEIGKCYIYELVDPRDKQTKYIGQTLHPCKRLTEHKYYRKYKINTKLISWIKKLYSINLEPIMYVIDKVEDKERDFYEQFYISLYKSWGFDLKNGTEGGNSGRRINKFKPSDEQIAKQRATLKEGYKTGRIINSNKDKSMSVEQKQLLSKNTNFRHLSIESINKRTLSNTGKTRTSEQKQKQSKGVILSLIKNNKIKPIVKLSLEDEYIDIYLGPKEASESIDSKPNSGNIIGCCKNKNKSCKGFKFRYTNKEETDKLLNSLTNI